MLFQEVERAELEWILESHGARDLDIYPEQQRCTCRWANQVFLDFWTGEMPAEYSCM